MRTLVVEDDVRMAAAVRRALRGAGVVADVTASGNDAQWMATASAYDVIVLDVELPDMNGFDACVQLRRGRVDPDHHGDRAGCGERPGTGTRCRGR